MLTTTSSVKGNNTLTADEALDEVNAEGATTNLVQWDRWWELKRETNERLMQAISERDAAAV